MSGPSQSNERPVDIQRMCPQAMSSEETSPESSEAEGYVGPNERLWRERQPKWWRWYLRRDPEKHW